MSFHLLRCFWVVSLILITIQKNEAQTVTAQAIQNEITRIMADPQLKHARLGLYVQNVKSNKVLLNHNGTKSFTPASVMKVISTATALNVLGKNYKFITRLEYDGIIQNGVLKGNLYIRGGGDPTLGAEGLGILMKTWTDAIKKLNIKRIDGKIVGDARIFEHQMTPPNWSWVDLGNYYGAGASGLSIHENMYRVYFKSGAKIGSATTVVRHEPKITNLWFTNEVTAGTKNSGDQSYIYGSPYSFHRYVRGTIPVGQKAFAVKGSMPDPALFCADFLRRKLQTAGVFVNGEATTVRHLKHQNKMSWKKRTVFHTHYSATLQEIVKKTNLKSMNLYAEHLFKMISQKLKGKGSTKVSASLIESHWRAKGINTGGLVVDDGSGLSRTDLVTPQQLTQILDKMQDSKNFDALFYSLPVAGKSGTMARRCRGTIAQGNLRAKTGSLTGVRSFSGYVTNPQGQRLAFTLMVNNYTGAGYNVSAKLEKLLVLVAKLKS